MRRQELIDLLESLVEEVKMNEESKDDIIREYSCRVLDVVEPTVDGCFLPEDDFYYID